MGLVDASINDGGFSAPNLDSVCSVSTHMVRYRPRPNNNFSRHKCSTAMVGAARAGASLASPRDVIFSSKVNFAVLDVLEMCMIRRAPSVRVLVSDDHITGTVALEAINPAAKWAHVTVSGLYEV